MSNGTPKTESDVMNIVSPLPGGVFLTGSRAFGVAGGGSDWDVCVMTGDKSEVMGKLQNYDTPIPGVPRTSFDSLYSNGSKVSIGTFPSDVVNVIPLHPLDAICWWMATQDMIRLTKIPGAKDKVHNRETRLGLFQAFVALHKLTIPYFGAEYAVYTLKCLMAGIPVPVYSPALDFEQLNGSNKGETA